MDLKIDPTLALAEPQLTLFMAAITALVELAKATDKDHIKLRALTEVARLCNPAKRSPPAPHGALSASDGPQASPSPHADGRPHAPAPVARAQGSQGSEFLTPSSPLHGGSATSRSLCSTPTLNRRQRRLLARLEANERKKPALSAA